MYSNLTRQYAANLLWVFDLTDKGCTFCGIVTKLVVVVQHTHNKSKSVEFALNTAARPRSFLPLFYAVTQKNEPLCSVFGIIYSKQPVEFF